MAEEPHYPITDIKWLLHACRADEPLALDDPRRHEFSSLRGCDVVTELADTLEQAQPQGTFHHRILCGHRGAGKSTELLALKQWADQSGFLTIWVQVDLFFGRAELQFSDLYLLTAQLVEKALREFRSPIPQKLLQSVVNWFAEVTEEDLEKLKLEAKARGEIGSNYSFLLAKLFARFTVGITAGSEHHHRIRRKIRQSPDTLITLTNTLLQVANKKLQGKKRPNGLLVLFDNLDRYTTDNINALLLNGATLIKPLACHAIFTMPIDLQYNPTGPYWDDYGPAIVLPMLAMREPSDAWTVSVAESHFTDHAVQELLHALTKRIDVATLFQAAEDASLLVKMSGGCMRDLLHLVNLARQKSRTRLADVLTVLTTTGVQQAIAEYRLTLTEGLQPTDFARLA